MTVDQIHAEYVVATDLFMSGANRSAADFRAPSFIGALRFWWRALAWARTGGALSAVAEQEEVVFGSTRRQAQALVEVKGAAELASRVEVTAPFKLGSWQAYAGYGLIPVDTRQRERFKGGRFQVSIRFKPPAPAGKRGHQTLSPETKRSVADALKVLGLLGGLGGRSRKGWGSVTLDRLQVTLDGESYEWSAPLTGAALEDELSKFLKAARACTARPPYSAFWRDSLVAVGQGQSRGTAHKLLARTYEEVVRDTRSSVAADFGLPRGDDNKRRASPVWLHVHAPTAADREFPVATLFISDFLAGRRDPPGNWEGPRKLLERVEQL